jgi:hypothetical protein
MFKVPLSNLFFENLLRIDGIGEPCESRTLAAMPGWVLRVLGRLSGGAGSARGGRNKDWG